MSASVKPRKKKPAKTGGLKLKRHLKNVNDLKSTLADVNNLLWQASTVRTLYVSLHADDQNDDVLQKLFQLFIRDMNKVTAQRDSVARTIAALPTNEIGHNSHAEIMTCTMELAELTDTFNGLVAPTMADITDRVTLLASGRIQKEPENGE